MSVFMSRWGWRWAAAATPENFFRGSYRTYLITKKRSQRSTGTLGAFAFWTLLGRSLAVQKRVQKGSVRRSKYHTDVNAGFTVDVLAFEEPKAKKPLGLDGGCRHTY